VYFFPHKKNFNDGSLRGELPFSFSAPAIRISSYPRWTSITGQSAAMPPEPSSARDIAEWRSLCPTPA
jgi:hypothetical protein